MIVVSYSEEKCAIAVTGHAGYASKGEDIVCSAVSALFQTALHMDGCDRKTSADGETKMVIIDTPTQDQEYAMRILAKGMESVAYTYPQWCSFVRE